MNDLIRIQKTLLPDLLEVMRKRYEILRHIHLMQPVGRRSLTSVLSMTERVLRAEVDFLRGQGLIRIESIGMHLNERGQELLFAMEDWVKEIFGLTELEQELAAKLQIDQVIVVPGDSDQSEWVKKEIGRHGAQLLKKMVIPNQVVAVAGGTTVMAVAEMMTPAPSLKSTLFVPTRGGLGEAVELEANYIASVLAKNSGGTYRLMHVPDQLSDEAYRTIIREPHIQAMLETLRQARIVIHGVGDAKRMAKRRKSTPHLLQHLDQTGAVGEAFGFYFNRQGDIVSRFRTVGLQHDDLKQVEYKIAVAGGASKAEAIIAVCANAERQILITDEAAAEQILK
ncbi:central glycolytic genes regulator [Seinonella peptonophila]|uniref:Central glycolytic genes regulator n=1 Tax=Seinonella peptonophila TaxID=112248 RepID=A0A1M4YMQ4_9BACL|nr:sugar-binding domain-containing protein [Seinonella peptonophila]SHF07095.1 central glycolytic genes regulator [Seinonella peptonophila]